MNYKKKEFKTRSNVKVITFLMVILIVQSFVVCAGTNDDNPGNNLSEKTQVSQAEIVDRFNVGNLRVNADFKVPISELLSLNNEIYWVPAVKLGKPDTTVRNLLKLKGKPQELKEEINTLYEASAYIQASGMNSYRGNKYVKHEGLIWQMSASPEFVLRENKANCFSMSNTVVYLLRGDYEEVGFVVWGAEIGGHIYNYIKKDGTYYVFDLRVFAIHAIDESSYPGLEDGTESEFYKGDLNGFVYEVPVDENGKADFSGLVEFVRRSTDICFMVLFPATTFEMTGIRQGHMELYVDPAFPIDEVISIYDNLKPCILRAKSAPEWSEGL